MPKSLEKTQKKINKKKGKVTALHENSRDSQRLRRAQGRDDKLVRVASARRKNNRPLLERAVFFQEAARQNEGKPLELKAIQALIDSFVAQFDEELCQIKKDRRPGRPASAREDLVKMKIATSEKEHRDGFYLPDLMDEANLLHLDKWQGEWSYLSNLKWVRISQDGQILDSKFPPKGQA